MKQVLNARSWLRIVLVSAVAAVPFVGLLCFETPGIQLEWIVAYFFMSVVIVVVLMAILPLLIVLEPPRFAFITRKGFGIWCPPFQVGYSHFRRSELKPVTLLVHDNGKQYLRIRTNQFCLSVEAGRGVALSKLRKLLGENLVIRDWRRRFPISS